MTNEHPSLKNVRKVSWLMDSCIRLPGGFRIGLDGLIGLVPGIGDAVGALFTLGVFASALHHKAPLSTLVKIALNMLVDLTLGAIPVVGDVFDFFFKSNKRSLALLERHLLNVTPSASDEGSFKQP